MHIPLLGILWGRAEMKHGALEPEGTQRTQGNPEIQRTLGNPKDSGIQGSSGPVLGFESFGEHVVHSSRLFEFTPNWHEAPNASIHNASTFRNPAIHIRKARPGGTLQVSKNATINGHSPRLSVYSNVDTPMHMYIILGRTGQARYLIFSTRTYPRSATSF